MYWMHIICLAGSCHPALLLMAAWWQQTVNPRNERGKADKLEEVSSTLGPQRLKTKAGWVAPSFSVAKTKAQGVVLPHCPQWHHFPALSPSRAPCSLHFFPPATSQEGFWRHFCNSTCCKIRFVADEVTFDPWTFTPQNFLLVLKVLLYSNFVK